jgi:hypothetical protein
VVAAAVLLAAMLAGCGDDDEKGTVRAAPSSSSPSTPAPSASSADPVSPAPATSAAATESAAPAPTTAAPSKSPTPAAPSASRPPAPTKLAVTIAPAGTRIDVRRGGPAQEITITMRNGNTAAYPRLAVMFQMEFMHTRVRDGDPQDGIVLERYDAKAGVWRVVPLRVANDAFPFHMVQGGAPLAKNEVRVERYRVSAKKEGPVGTTDFTVSVVDPLSRSEDIDAARPGYKGYDLTARM